MNEGKIVHDPDGVGVPIYKPVPFINPCWANKPPLRDYCGPGNAPVDPHCPLALPAGSASGPVSIEHR
jgi:hypothetical protein